jgi:hypothetical protein
MVVNCPLVVLLNFPQSVGISGRATNQFVDLIHSAGRLIPTTVNPGVAACPVEDQLRPLLKDRKGLFVAGPRCSIHARVFPLYIVNTSGFKSLLDAVDVIYNNCHMILKG